ncbi:GNAT family N-acetyltransferase [Maricaulis salignorans]|uniref:Protein N-acetyltransferase, RimJ/RimL family n=1 Tax=Maricaulis salignorans TaxID=144026 RepID=A0A1G9SQE0_9PROT|nr:GNAT family N-acetyltransferase [Maricaulis salignorans]SDM37631.1 Protein N-acetyltransferase, RimJ/RimL family [Maricaulis salignorans]
MSLPPPPTIPTLVTERLVLRGHTSDDFAGSLALWTDPGVIRFIGGRASSEHEVWQRLLRYGGMWAMLGYGYWAITDRADGRFLGEAGLADLKREITPPLDGVPESGWALLPAAHGRGLGGEAMRAVLDWADQALDRPETCCIIDPGNTASTRLAGKLGYRARHTARLAGNALTVFYRPREPRAP